VVCLGLLAAAVALLSGTAVAQPCEAGWLPGEARAGLSSGGTGYGKALSFALQPDGGVIIGFNYIFTDRAGTHRGIVRYDPATETFTRMGNGTDSPAVDTVLALPDGDAVMPHDLPSGVSILGIPRYDFATGTWVSIGAVRPNFRNCFAVTPGGDLVMGGTFTSVGLVPARNIARVNPDTGVWSPLGAGLNGMVSSVAVFPDGVIVAAGSFTASGTVPMPRLAAYDPVLNTWSALAVDQPVVEKVAVSAEGVLYGIATITQGGQTRRTVAEYDRTTRVWRGLGFGSTLSPEFTGMAVSTGGPSQVVVYRDGGLVYSLNRATDSWEPLPFGGASSMFILPSGDILAGGHFSLNYQSNQGRSGAIRFRPSVGEWATIGRGLDGAVVDMELDPSGTVWLGGRFRSTGGQCASGVARFDPIDGSFQTFPPRQFEHTSDLVLSETLGLVAVTDAPESDAPGGASILRLDPLRGQWSRVAARRPNGTFSGPPFGTRVLNELPDGTLVANGVAFARFDPTTWIWSFPPGLPLDAIYAQAVLPDGSLVVGGTSRLDILNTTTNTLTPLASAVNGTVHAIEILPYGDIVVGGNFTAIGGVPAANIARRSHETGTWTALGQGLVPVNPSSVAAASIRYLGDGKLVVGGRFSSAGDQPASNVAIYDLGTGAWSPLGSGVTINTFENYGPSYVKSILPMPDGGILFGGSIAQAGGHISYFLARYASTNPPAILQQPRPALLCSGGEIAMSFGVGSTREAAFRWQWQPPASSEWIDLVEGDNLVGDVPVLATSGVNRRTISASALEGLPAESPIQLRCIATTPCGEVTSTAASLTLRAPCACYDFNRDLEIDLADAHDMAAVFTGLRLSEPGWLDGDLNNDENADLTDAQLLAAYVVSGTCGV
jgi:hypothetical protein